MAFQYDPTKLGARLIKFMFQPRIPCPDYGFSPPFALFETSCRSGPYGKIEMIELFADGPQTVTPDFSPIAVAGQPTLRYCESWQGITITTIAAGITSRR